MQTAGRALYALYCVLFTPNTGEKLRAKSTVRLFLSFHSSRYFEVYDLVPPLLFVSLSCLTSRLLPPVQDAVDIREMGIAQLSDVHASQLPGCDN